MKIGFFGDSWIAFNHSHLIKFPYTEWAWPNQVGNNFKGDHIYTGHGGTHLFYAYQQLIKEIDNIDYVILSVSDYERVPNEYGINTMCPCEYGEMHVKSFFGDLGGREAQEFISYIKTHCKYYPTQMSYAAQKGLLLEIDEVLGKKNKKALIIPGFKESFVGYTFKNAAYLDCSFNEIKVKDKRKEIPPKKLKRMFEDRTLIALNHFLKQEADVIADAITELIKQEYSPGKKEFKKYFNYLFD